MAEERERMEFEDVRDGPTGKKLFRYDASRDIIETKKDGKRYLVDMQRLRNERRKNS